MAELTQLESKIGEVIGLAQAAQDAGDKVRRLVEEEGERDLAQTLQEMAKEAAQTEERCTQLLDEFEGKKTAILEEASSAKQKAKQMMSAYLDSDADALDGLEFLTMAEAGETGHWSLVGKLNEKARIAPLQEIVEWVTPIQERHFQQVVQGSLQLAEAEDPNAPA